MYSCIDIFVIFQFVIFKWLTKFVTWMTYAWLITRSIWCINVLIYFANFDAAMLRSWYLKNSRSSWHEWHMNESWWLRTWCTDVWMYGCILLLWYIHVEFEIFKWLRKFVTWMTCEWLIITSHVMYNDVLMFFLNSMLLCWVRGIQMTHKVRDVNDIWMTHYTFTFDVCC